MIGDVDAFARGHAVLSGTLVSGGAAAFGESRVTLSAGIVEEFRAQDDATLTIRGGTVRGNLAGAGSAEVTMTGGTVEGRAILIGQSTLHFAGGQILGGISGGNGGDSAARLLLDAVSVINAEPFPEMIELRDEATLNIYGTDLMAELIDPAFADGIFSLYYLDGVLADGTTLADSTTLIENNSVATYAFFPPAAIPEPSALATALFGIGAGILRRSRGNLHSTSSPRRDAPAGH